MRNTSDVTHSSSFAEPYVSSSANSAFFAMLDRPIGEGHGGSGGIRLGGFPQDPFPDPFLGNSSNSISAMPKNLALQEQMISEYTGFPPIDAVGQNAFSSGLGVPQHICYGPACTYPGCLNVDPATLDALPTNLQEPVGQETSQTAAARSIVDSRDHHLARLSNHQIPNIISSPDSRTNGARRRAQMKGNKSKRTANGREPGKARRIRAIGGACFTCRLDGTGEDHVSGACITQAIDMRLHSIYAIE
ncbi:hypothetical protein BU16DRAFT_122981 [Lophium mytilinum]|uniref:Uncharacterized protein n=1 Tax=Lophium mytilinum TaxID=390894 RepID=A0A6A6QHA9_9PEZI|nr:hypothetical protein BU16DRAFT_122981 [Lophium mytilinum]